MLNFPPTVRIWLGTQPVDLRKSFDSLAEQVRQHLHNDPLSGHIFVFRNKRGDRVKLLYWDEGVPCVDVHRQAPQDPAEGGPPADAGGQAAAAAKLLDLVARPRRHVRQVQAGPLPP
jgi:transposase